MSIELETMTSEDLREATKAIGALKSLYKAENRDVYGRPHAAKGGEYGVDGLWYEGGEFLPNEEYREFQLKIKGAGKSFDPDAPRKSNRGEVSIWEILRLKSGMTEPRLIADADIKAHVEMEVLGGWYKIDNLISENAVDYYIAAKERAFECGCTRYELTAEKAKEEIANLVNRFNEVFSEMQKSAKAANAVATHLFNLRRNGVYFVSEVYVLAVRKAAAEKYGIALEPKTPWKFSFRRKGQRKNSVWFYLNTNMTVAEACRFWQDRHPETTEISGHRAVDILKAKGDIYLAFETMPLFLANKLPKVEL